MVYVITNHLKKGLKTVITGVCLNKRDAHNVFNLICNTPSPGYDFISKISVCDNSNRYSVMISKDERADPVSRHHVCSFFDRCILRCGYNLFCGKFAYGGRKKHFIPAPIEKAFTTHLRISFINVFTEK